MKLRKSSDFEDDMSDQLSLEDDEDYLLDSEY